jgi:hypothetical protein
MILCTLAPIGFAQLSTDQKVADFNQLAALYAKNYAPYELRRDFFGFDLYNIQPWLDQVKQSKTDLDFYDICVKYVASLQDSHDEFTLPSIFEAWLHMDVDVYDGKVLIGYIDDSYLSARKYPFEVGDEVVSVDGTAAADLITQFLPYAVNGEGSKISRMRLAAGSITDRYQGWMPKAPMIGDTATVVIRRQSGKSETYEIPWDKIGVPITNAGLVPSPHAAPAAGTTRQAIRNAAIVASRRPLSHKRNPWGVWTGPRPVMQPDAVPSYLETLSKLQHMEAAPVAGAFSGAGIFPFGSTFPLFDPPDGFVLRLGARSTDLFLSGTFPVGSYKVGLIRIPTMSPSSTTTALNQFLTEIQYMQANTDGLVIDVMGNGGGSVCYTQSLVSILTPYTFRGATEQLRATLNWVASFSSAVESAKQQGAPQWVIDLYGNYLKDVQEALAENRGLTGNEPLCSYTFDVNPPVDSKGNVLAYKKPILVLTDSFTLSAAEMFSMFLQDANRATIFGTRTDGGGGNVVAFSSAANYSEGDARVTEGLLTRAHSVQTPGFPASVYYDGMGIYPDIVQDYQTQDNLLNYGATFIDAFSSAISDLITKSK